MQRFKSLTVGGNASPDFGGDRLVIVGDMALTQGNSLLSAPEIILQGDLNIDTASVTIDVDTTEGLVILGNLNLSNGAVLSTRAANTSTQTINDLKLTVTGRITVDESSVIDVSGRGYPDRYHGPGYISVVNGYEANCHAGTNRNGSNVNCTPYGRYERARYAGGGTLNASGGGIIELYADELVLDGKIKANGDVGTNYGGGAGGSIHIEVVTLSGDGEMQAYGENSTNNAGIGGGGRISVYSDESSGYSGTYITSSVDVVGANGGAGTVYLKNSAESYGHLLIDNADHQTLLNSTPIRSVGQQSITLVEYLGDAGDGESLWQISVSGTPWKASGQNDDYGLDGIEVDLDATDVTGALYEIISNTTNSITLKTADDLLSSVSLGNELVGVHHFESLTVRGNASPDFGGDRVILVNDMNLSGISTEISTDMLIQGNLNLSNGAALTTRAANTSTQTINDLKLTVTGTITVDEFSVIDVSGRGYPDRYHGPGYISVVNGYEANCHAGTNRNGSNVNCTPYGRYERARYAGGGTLNASGGGIIELYADELVLDGKIKANGDVGTNYGGGAGGSIHIEVVTLSGDGEMQAYGENSTNNAGIGGGGRISVYSDESSGYSGTYITSSVDVVGANGGAGTVYLKNSAESYGHLLIDNADHQTLLNSTPIRSVGRHVITGVVDTTTTNASGEKIWEVSVGDTPWTATEEGIYSRDLGGLTVDLNAIDIEGTLYTIVSNTNNTLTIHSNSDLSLVQGNELIGVHRFGTVTVTGNGAADFGGDRILVVDVLNTSVNPESAATASGDSFQAFNPEQAINLLNESASLTSSGLDTIAVYSFTLDQASDVLLDIPQTNFSQGVYASLYLQGSILNDDCATLTEGIVCAGNLIESRMFESISSDGPVSITETLQPGTYIVAVAENNRVSIAELSSGEHISNSGSLIGGSFTLQVSRGDSSASTVFELNGIDGSLSENEDNTGSVNYHSFTLTDATLVAMHTEDKPTTLALFNEVAAGDVNPVDQCRNTSEGYICDTSFIIEDQNSSECDDSPWIHRALAPGDYILAVGAQPLSIIDAVNGSNTAGAEFIDYRVHVNKNTTGLSSIACGASDA